SSMMRAPHCAHCLSLAMQTPPFSRAATEMVEAARASNQKGATGTKVARTSHVGWQLESHRPLFALVTADGGCAMLKDEYGRCLMLVFTTAIRAETVGKSLGVPGHARRLPGDVVALVSETRQVGAVGIVVDYDPARGEGPVMEQWVPDLSV